LDRTLVAGFLGKFVRSLQSGTRPNYGGYICGPVSVVDKRPNPGACLFIVGAFRLVNTVIRLGPLPLEIVNLRGYIGHE
jgi:hypothetical protein